MRQYKFNMLPFDLNKEGNDLPVTSRAEKSMLKRCGYRELETTAAPTDDCKK